MAPLSRAFFINPCFCSASQRTIPLKLGVDRTFVLSATKSVPRLNGGVIPFACAFRASGNARTAEAKATCNSCGPGLFLIPQSAQFHGIDRRFAALVDAVGRCRKYCYVKGVCCRIARCHSSQHSRNVAARCRPSSPTTACPPNARDGPD
jgi:hypothetical protein